MYALLISRQEEIIELVKPLLPKPTVKPRVIHISKSSNYMCIYSTNAIIVLFKVSCYVASGSTGCTYNVKCINLSIVLSLSCTLYKLMTTNII